jgi:hypothetical protein
MKLWATISAGLIPALLFAYRWFLLKTDVFVGYGWKCDDITGCYPRFDIRNRSGSKTYVLGNIAYTRGNGGQILAIDNKSIWGKELKPGTITHLDGAPVPSITCLQQCPAVEVRVRLQNEREFKGQGPGQLYKGVRKIAFSLRQKLEKASMPLTP